MRGISGRSLALYIVVLFLIFAVTGGRAQAGDFYVGASGAVDRLNILYKKAVDSTNPRNITSNRGQTHRSEAEASGFAYNYGFLGGYKEPLSISGIYVAVEGELLRYGGTTQGSLAGSGNSVGNNQAGEVWPENWVVNRRQSYGVTGRVGVGLPLIGRWLGPSVYGLVGFQRLNANFQASYTGCLTATICHDRAEFVTGTDNYDEGFMGRVLGGGVEKKVGNFALRGEVRVTSYSEADRVIPYDDLFISVPKELNPDSVSFGVTLLWYF